MPLIGSWGSSKISTNRYHHTTNVNDTFNRANSATAVGTADTGGTWTTQRGTWGITGNQAYLVTAAASGVNDVTIGGSADGFAQVTIDGTPVDGMGLAFRYTDTNNHMVMARSNAFGTWNINKVVSGTGTFVANIGLAASTAGTTIRVEYVGSLIWVFVDGVLKNRISESANSTGTGVGLRLPASATQAPRFDNFSAGG